MPILYFCCTGRGLVRDRVWGQGSYSASPSCYNWQSLERRHAGRFDISKPAFARMMQQLDNSQLQVVPSRSSLHSTLSALMPAVHTLPPDGILFFYYDNDNDGMGNSGCHFYASMKLQGSPVQPTRQLTPPIDGPPCDRASLELARLYKATTEPKAAFLATPFEQYVLITHPDAAISSRYQEAQLDTWLLFAEQFHLPDNLVPERDNWIEVPIPTWIHRITRGGSVTKDCEGIGSQRIW